MSEMPAARVGDPSMHGGVIIPPGALPNRVLIENQPAARVGDMHTCPMVTGVVPHVGGPIVMASPTVIIGGLPAARSFDLASCTGPPDAVSKGAAKTMIGYGAAPGPLMVTVIGNPVRAFEQFPGRQHYQNCYPQSIQQIVRQGFGANHSEGAMERFAAPHGYWRDWGTPMEAGPNILRDASAGRLRATFTRGDAGAAARALEEGRGVVGFHDAGQLWNDARYLKGGHAVHVTGALRDSSSGRIIGVIINDTGTGYAGQAIGAARYNAASLGEQMVTAGKIW